MNIPTPGNDTLSGSAGDTLAGGLGDDLYQLGSHDITVIEQPGEGNDKIELRDDTYTGVIAVPLNVETLVLIGRFNNMQAQGNAQDNAIYGNNTGNDTIDGGAGNDYIQGDFAYFYGSNSWSSWTGNDLLHGGDGNDVLWGDQRAGFGNGNDTLYGDAGNDTLYGEGGNDLLYGGEGNDLLTGGETMAGGAGDDSYLLARYGGIGTVVESPVAGETNTIQLGAGVLPSQVDLAREGNDLVFRITGYASSQLAVKDYFAASTPPVARAVFEDGTVWDASVFAAAPNGASQQGLYVVGTASADNLEGRAGNDTFDGMAGWDNIAGGGGDDYLLGGGGNDNLSGGDGNDRLDGGFDNDNLSGGAGNDTLIGDQGYDVFQGGAGDDVIDPGTDYNRLSFFVGDGHDVVRGLPGSTNIYVSGLGIDLASYFYYVPNAPVRGLQASELAFTRAGDNLVITVKANGESITVEGWFVPDAAGNYQQLELQTTDHDWYNADILAAMASGQGEGGGGTPGTPGTVGTEAADTLAGTAGDDLLWGRGGNDLLQGGAGNDFLNGELGNDSLVGGTGDDMLIVDSTGDVVTELAGEGSDTVQSYVDYTLGANVENLVLIGDIARTGTGNGGDNRITGNAQANRLDGGNGADTIDGGGGADTLLGGRGADVLVVRSGLEHVDGGAGSDVLRIDAALAAWNVGALANGTIAGIETIDLRNGTATQL
uniref:calcium-binding protein n=1 Tax=Ramlibacter sp. TaxID=1917967 RepID=UPI0017ED8E2F